MLLHCSSADNFLHSRQSNTDKAASALKPDSQKSALEQVQDSAKSTADSVAGTLQPGKPCNSQNINSAY